MKAGLLQKVQNVCTPHEKREKQRGILIDEFYRRSRDEKTYRDATGFSWEKPKQKPIYHFTNRRMRRCGLSPKVFQAFLNDIVRQELEGQYTFYLLRDGLHELLDLSFEERMQYQVEHYKNRFLSKAKRLQKFHHHINEYLADFRQNIYDDETNDYHQVYFDEMLKHHWLKELDVDRASYDQCVKQIGKRNRKELDMADEYASLAGEPDWLGYQAEQNFYYENGERDTPPTLVEYQAEKKIEQEEEQVQKIKRQVAQVFGRHL